MPPTRLPDKSSASLLRAELLKGANLYGSGRYDDAAKQFDLVSNLAAQAHNPSMSARARGNVGAVQLAMHQYRAALNSLIDRAAHGRVRRSRQHNRHTRCESRFPL